MCVFHEMVILSGMRLTYWETGLPSWLRGNSVALAPPSSSRAGEFETQPPVYVVDSLIIYTTG